MALTPVTLTGASETIKAGWTKFNNLITDLLSTSAGLGASVIGVRDAAGNLDAENVEDAITEIYSDIGTSISLAETLNENSATTTALTWGYKTGLIRFDNTVTSVAAGTISLTDNATNYIEVQSDGTVSRNTTGFTSGRLPLRTVVTLAGVQTTSTDKRSFLQSWDIPLPVAKGGTGATSLTDGGILLGSGTGAITALGVATNGQIPIGDGTTDPVLGNITATATQITVTNGAGSIALSFPADVIIPTVLTVPNTGLHILDTNASHDLILACNSNLTADRQVNFVPGDSAATAMLGDGGTTKAWFYQNVAPTGWTIDATPADAVLAVKGGSNAYNANGGTQAGTWTQPNHDHTYNTVIAHTHPLGAGAGIRVLTSSGSLAYQEIVGSYDISSYSATGSTGSASGTTAGGATAATYRPLGQIGIICTLNA